MKYMLIMRDSQEAIDASRQIDFEEIINAMGAYNESMMKAGVFGVAEGLAPAVLRVITDRLQELRMTGLAVLVAEQNVDLALALSDRVFILGEEGRMVWTGDSASLVTNPAPIHLHLGL